MPKRKADPREDRWAKSANRAFINRNPSGLARRIVRAIDRARREDARKARMACQSLITTEERQAATRHEGGVHWALHGRSVECGLAAERAILRAGKERAR